MLNLGYYNGKYDLIENMTIPMNDRAVYFGDGIYEVAFCRNYKIYALDEHMERLFDGAAILGIDIPLSKKEFSDLIYNLSEKLSVGSQLIYWQVSRGTEMRSHAPAAGIRANILVTIKPAEIKNTYAPMKLILLEDTRYLHCNMKTLNLLPSVLASMEAARLGADEAVLHRNGRVTECAHSNISIIKAGTLITAPADNLILAGIARAHLLSAANALNIRTEERPYTTDELFAADEIIISASSNLCRPVTQINETKTGGRSPALLKSLQDYLLNDYLEKTK